MAAFLNKEGFGRESLAIWTKRSMIQTTSQGQFLSKWLLFANLLHFPFCSLLHLALKGQELSLCYLIPNKKLLPHLFYT